MADKFDPKVVQAWKKEVKAAKDDIKEITDLSAVLEKSTQNLTKSQIKQNKNMSEFVDHSVKAAKQGKLSLGQLKNRIDLVQDISKGELTVSQIKDKQRDIEAEQIKNLKNNFGGNQRIVKLKNQELEKDLKLLASEEKRLKAQEISSAGMSELDGLTDGLSGKAADFSSTWKEMGPNVAITAAAFAVFAAMLTKFSGDLDAIGEKFGALGVQEFSADLMAADAEMAKLGYDSGTASDMAQQLSDNYGIAFSESIKLAPEIADMSKALGMSVDEGGAFVGQLTTMTGMSAEAAIDMAKMTEQLAAANGVAPGSVMRDIAASSESVALFSQDSGENIMKGAIMAKKLGMSLDDVAGTMEEMLDFTGAQQKAMEASVLLGRDVNVTKLQELSLAGDAAGVLEEQVKLLGDSNKWNKMNSIEKKALASAVGLEVDQAAKLVNKTEEQASLAGELAKQPGFGDLVGKEAMSSLAELMGQLTSIGAELTNIFGPILNSVVGIFASLATKLKESKVLMGILMTVVGALGLKLLWMGIGAIWSGASMALGWIPIVGPALAMIASIAGTAALLSAVTGIGDMSMEAGKGPTVSTNVGAFQLDKKDDLVAGPGVVDSLNADGTPAAGGGGVSVDVTPVVTAVVGLQGTVQLQQAELSALRADMQSYLGPNGTLAKAVGKKTVAAINDQGG